MKHALVVAILFLLSSCKTSDGSELSGAVDNMQGRWTDSVSEENGENSPAVCPNGVVSGMRCQGSHCDNISLQCTGSYAGAEGSWSSYYSEEGSHENVCPDGSYVTGVRCQGRYCDNVALRCSPRPDLKASFCYWSLPLPDYKAPHEFPKGTRMTGLRCSGRYCGSPSARLCLTETPPCADEACYEELAKTFAPLLRFDQEQGAKNKCFPGPADEYFAARKSGSKERICNTDYATIKEGKVPVYYHYQSCGANEVTILYWFYYGYQDSCSPGSGAHDADWEHIAVKVKNGALEKVMYYQHSGSYTRELGKFELFDKTHPVVYVGKNSHGSYHDNGGTGSCLYFEDFRNPGKKDQKMQTWMNLVHLKDGPESPEWMTSTEKVYWDNLPSPLPRKIAFCEQRSCKGKDFNLGTTLCFGQCGCKKSSAGDAPF